MEPTIGALRHLLTVEAPNRADDSGGGAVIAWAEVTKAWAAIMPTSGTEKVIGDGVRERVTHEILVRYRANLDATMRFVSADGRVFEIKAVLGVGERRRWTKCLCEERLA